MGKFPRWEYTKIVGKLKKLVEDRGESRGTGLENYSRYTIKSTRFGGVELKKGFPNVVCRELNRGHSQGCRVRSVLLVCKYCYWYHVIQYVLFHGRVVGD